MRRWLLLGTIIVGFAFGCNDGNETTKPDPEVVLPIQSNIVCTPTEHASGIAVTWTTDVPASGVVYYGTSSPPTDYVWEGDSHYDTDHLVNVYGEPSTLYYIQVKSCLWDPERTWILICGAKQPAVPETCRTAPYVDQYPPMVEWVYPRDGSDLGGVIDLRAEATDDVGVDHVSFYVDGNLVGIDTTPPDCQDDFSEPLYCVKQWDSASVSDGNHSLAASAYDRAGGISSHTVHLTIDNRPRFVEWVHPRDGDVLAPDRYGRVQLRVRAWKAGGSPEQTVFWRLDGVPIQGSLLTYCEGPWDPLIHCQEWYCRHVPAGTHTLTAIVGHDITAEASITVTK